MAKKGDYGATPSKPKPYARVELREDQAGMLHNLEIGEKAEFVISGKVTSIEMRKGSDGYNCNSFCVEPVQVKMTKGGEYEELAEDD